MIFFVSLPKPKQTNMKQFAFPLSVKCASIEERDKCLNFLESIGYENAGDFTETARRVITNYGNFSRLATAHPDDSLNYHNNRHYIDHFNPALIRDIAAACTNDEWHDGEPIFDCVNNHMNYRNMHKEGCRKIDHYASLRRPTLAEICAHHGYEIKGRDIVKKIETVSNCDKSYCETARQLDEAKAEIKCLKSENAELKEKLEAITDVGNQELAILRSENAELKRKNDSFVSIGKVCGELTEVFNSSKDIRIKQLQSKVDELANKLQYNDKLHVKELEMLTDMITELSRDKAELITKLNCLSAPAGIFHTSRPLEFHPINLPNMFQTKPAEFSEREKKRLLRLAERIERLFK